MYVLEIEPTLFLQILTPSFDLGSRQPRKDIIVYIHFLNFHRVSRDQSLRTLLSKAHHKP